MSLRGKKLGLLLATGPETPPFRQGLGLAAAAVCAGVDVYLYCIDDAVTGVTDPQVQALKARGVRLFACAHAAQRRGLALSEAAAFSGLAVVSDLIASTDRFLSFSQSA